MTDLTVRRLLRHHRRNLAWAIFRGDWEQIEYRRNAIAIIKRYAKVGTT